MMVATMNLLPSLALAIATLPIFVIADGSYRSRPDLSPPHLNITIPCNGRCEAGYLFVAPFTGFADPVDHGPLQQGPYIFTDDGELVWSGYTYFSTWSGNFQAARWNGEDILFAFEGAHNSLHGHGHGHHTIMNQQYQNIRELRAGNHMLSDKHEFIIINETTALFQIYHPLQKDLSLYGGREGQTWIVDARFQEMDIETGRVLFEWNSLDHISPDETALPLPLGQAGMGYNSSTAWDYFHINSITKGEDGHYLVSARHASTIYKIDGTDGSIIWRLGGKHSDFELGPEVAFGFQHHARYVSGGNKTHEMISLFDNSVYGSEAAGGGDKEVHLYPYSRGKYITLDHTTMKASLELAFLPPRKPILAKSQGSLQVLPQGNVLINWGSEGQVTEYGPDGEPLFHAFLDSGSLQENLQNYRAFRFNWTGFSPETPAIFAEEVEDGEVDVYVSWNGDTRTVRWRIQWTEDTTRTRLPVRGAKIDEISALALSATGEVLAVSEEVSASPAFWLRHEQRKWESQDRFQFILNDL
ncbi:ASST-domain-containing protein [Aspergillus californicus]